MEKIGRKEEGKGCRRRKTGGHKKRDLKYLCMYAVREAGNNNNQTHFLLIFPPIL